MIRIIRTREGRNSTLSHLYLNDLFLCYLLEDRIREHKIDGKTCIPEGTYQLAWNQTAGMNKQYSRKWGKRHRGMIEILGIPDFSLIFFHVGNTHLNTAGCPLTGMYFRKLEEDFEVMQSAQAYRMVYPILQNQMEKEQNQVEVINRIQESKLIWK